MKKAIKIILIVVGAYTLLGILLIVGLLVYLVISANSYDPRERGDWNYRRDAVAIEFGKKQELRFAENCEYWYKIEIDEPQTFAFTISEHSERVLAFIYTEDSSSFSEHQIAPYGFDAFEIPAGINWLHLMAGSEIWRRNTVDFTFVLTPVDNFVEFPGQFAVEPNSTASYYQFEIAEICDITMQVEKSEDVNVSAELLYGEGKWNTLHLSFDKQEGMSEVEAVKTVPEGKYFLKIDCRASKQGADNSYEIKIATSILPADHEKHDAEYAAKLDKDAVDGELPLDVPTMFEMIHTNITVGHGKWQLKVPKESILTVRVIDKAEDVSLYIKINGKYFWQESSIYYSLSEKLVDRVVNLILFEGTNMIDVFVNQRGQDPLNSPTVEFSIIDD